MAGDDMAAELVTVSAERSTAKLCASLATTVRQAPEQAMDAPMATVSMS
jgi:hypothetical protein